MVAPNYAARRSKLAKQAGLGRRVVDVEDAEKQEPLQQMPDRPWQIVSAPEPVAAPEPAERRPEPTLDSVFGRFPKAQSELDKLEPEHAASESATGQRRPARKPFSKQLARTMRP
jgi:hypothetical protein